MSSHAGVQSIVRALYKTNKSISMKLRRFCPAIVALSLLTLSAAKAAPAPDATVEAAATLKIQAPVMCREWHIWWGAPLGVRPHVPTWEHWKGLQRYGRFDAAATIDEVLPDCAWRRYLNCVGYPLLGPYDSSQPDIIRWQLETARNAGLACLHVHLWPSLWDAGTDYTPLPIFERILEEAARLHYPVGVHDEIMFRSPQIARAQELDQSIRRLSLLVKRYGQHPGWYKIDGMPVIYFQNWNHWLSAPGMARLLHEVEKEAGPVYWMVEMDPDAEYVKIPELKAFFSANNGWFLHVAPFGAKPHPWEELRAQQQQAAALARKYGKKYGALVFSRFNNNNDRGQPGSGAVDAEGGMYYVDSLRLAQEVNPDFIVVTQWNDFEEGGFIEPAWDFDGFNGDPYRYCRITAAAMGRAFSPAAPPAREQVDPFIRHKLYGNTQSGDMGPVFHGAKLADGRLSWIWAQGSGDPATLRIVQDSLLHWRPNDAPFGGIHLANPGTPDAQGVLAAGAELRFFVPALARSQPCTLWLGVRVAGPKPPAVRVDYRSVIENYRVDSRWERQSVGTGETAGIDLEDGSRVAWQPLYGVQLAGSEGDLTLHAPKDASCQVLDVILWAPELTGSAVAATWQTQSVPLPSSVRGAEPFVVVAYDNAGNAGLPRLFSDGQTTPASSRNPMDLLERP